MKKLLRSSALKKLPATIFVCCALAAGPSAARDSPVSARLFDRFGNTCCDDEKARLDNAAIELQNTPGATLYIIYYGGRLHRHPWCHSPQTRLPRRGEADARAARLKPYIVNTRGIAVGRVITINGGYREAWEADVWIVPKGAVAPRPTPTVDPKEIRFRRGRPRGGDYFCDV